jgi:hypothetical protein
MNIKANIFIAFIFLISTLEVWKSYRLFPTLLRSLDVVLNYEKISRVWTTPYAGEFALYNKA